MGIILVAGIVAFYFFNKKKMTFGEWVRQLHILLKLGIFTGIIGFILNVISSWFFANELTPFIYIIMTYVGEILIFLLEKVLDDKNLNTKKNLLSIAENFL